MKKFSNLYFPKHGVILNLSIPCLISNMLMLPIRASLVVQTVKNLSVKRWHHRLNGHEFEQTPTSGRVRVSYPSKLLKDREAWCAAVHGVIKSWTRLINWTAITVDPIASAFWEDPEPHPLLSTITFAWSLVSPCWALCFYPCSLCHSPQAGKVTPLKCDPISVSHLRSKPAVQWPRSPGLWSLETSLPSLHIALPPSPPIPAALASFSKLDVEELPKDDSLSVACDN